MADRNMELALRMRADLQQARRQLQAVDQDLKGLSRGGFEAGKGIQRFTRETDKAERSSARFVSTVGRLRGMLATLGVSLAVRQMILYSDTLSGLESQLSLVTNSQQEMKTAFKDTYQVAQETRQDLESTVKLYARMAQSTEELNLTHEELLTLTKAISQSYVVSGASSQEAASSAQQLAQAMASGVLRGDELNSVLENSPRLARAIAEGLGVTTGQLRALGSQGELTAEQITRALLRTSGSIDRDFQKVERTVGQAMQQLRNDLVITFGGAETEGFAEAIDGLRSVVTDPGFQQSMVTLGTAVADLVGWMGRGISTGVDFTRWAAEELAVLTNGISGHDIVRLEQRADEIRELLDRPASKGNQGNQLRFFDSSDALKYRDDTLKAELASLEQQIQTYYDNQPPLVVKVKPSLEGGENTPPPLSLGNDGENQAAAKQYEAALKTLSNLQQGLKQQVATFDEGEAAALEYRLTLGDLSDEVARLGTEGHALAASIVQQAKELEGLAEAKRLEADAERLRTQAQQQAEQELERILDRVNPARVLERQLELIEELKQQFPEYAAALEQAAAQVQGRMGELNQGLMNAGAINASFAFGATNAMGSFIEDVASGRDAIDSLSDAFRNFAADFLMQIAQMIMQQTIFNALQNSDGQGIGGFIAKVAQLHGGGVVGRGGTERDIFANAPRYHTGGIAGLAPDEVPAILRKGEEVLTTNDPRHRENQGGGQSLVVQVNNTLDPDDLAQTMLSTHTATRQIKNIFKAEKSSFRAILDG